ncbi:hypothetical protein [Rhizobacter sp. Root1221]|uniref:phage fiber-tail adaptor protein n=1 Tax=Rhizobacter sp. Root1221 TaxID=1736433 RepID=UPI0006FC7CA7|nr:hypothetical protein [Rhizobacter sp. Root1221]KQV85436.1 hypothetical protein ASC87_07020 [Rhizobacter sp. Root1221]
MATTGSAWDLSNKFKPVARFDLDAVRDIPFDWTSWLADIESAYASHAVIAADGLEVVQTSVAAGVVIARVRVAPDATIKLNSQLRVTCRITAADGQVEDQSVFLKMVEK